MARRSHVYCPPDIPRDALYALLLRHPDGQQLNTRGWGQPSPWIAWALPTAGLPWINPPA